MSRHAHLIRPYELRRLIVDLRDGSAQVDAQTNVGILRIDLHELHAYGGADMLGECFDASTRALIERFSSAARRDFQ